MKNADILLCDVSFLCSNELFNPEILRPDLDFYNIQEMPDRSIDNNLDDTGDFLAWANEKRKGTNLDPENRRPIQVRTEYFKNAYIHNRNSPLQK